MQTKNVTLAAAVLAAAVTTAKDLAKGILAGLIPAYFLAAMWTHSFTPGLGDLLAPPDGYQSVRAWRSTHLHDFPALHPEPRPSRVGGAGHLVEIRDGTLYGTTATDTPAGPAPDVKTLRIARLFGPDIVAHLDVPLDPDLQEHLRSLRKGAVVTVAGIGHGDGKYNVYIYPVHQVNRHAP